MFPKERYQYSKKPSDNPYENNNGSPIGAKCTEQTANRRNETEIAHPVASTFDDLNQHAMDAIDECDALTDTSSHSNANDENVDDVLFMSTFDKSQIEMIESDDDGPIYDDADWGRTRAHMFIRQQQNKLR